MNEMSELPTLNEQLMEAVESQDLARVQGLLDEGAEATWVKRYEDEEKTIRSVLDSAVTGSPEILRLLIEHGACADDCIGGDGSSPWQLCVCP